MKLSYWELTSVRFITEFYRFLWKSHGSWNFRVNIAETISNGSEMRVYIAMIYFSLALMTLTTCNIFIYPILLPNHDFGRVDVLISLIGSIGISCLYWGINETMKNRLVIAGSFDAMCRLESDLGHKYRCKPAGSSYREIVTFLAIVTFATFTFVAPVGFVVAGFDPLRYLFDYFCPHPIDRSVMTIVLGFLLRTAGYIFICLELFRSTCWALFILLLTINRVFSIRLSLGTCLCCKNPKPAVVTLQMVYIIWNNVVVYLTKTTNIALTAIFVEIVMLTWLCIKASPVLLGSLLYYWLVILLVLLMTIMIGYLRTICWILDQAQEIVLAVKLQTWLLHVKRFSKETKYIRLTARAITPIRLKYCFMGQLGVGFLVVYIYALILRVLDAVLIVDLETRRM